MLFPFPYLMLASILPRWANGVSDKEIWPSTLRGQLPTHHAQRHSKRDSITWSVVKTMYYKAGSLNLVKVGLGSRRLKMLPDTASDHTWAYSSLMEENTRSRNEQYYNAVHALATNRRFRIIYRKTSVHNLDCTWLGGEIYLDRMRLGGLEAKSAVIHAVRRTNEELFSFSGVLGLKHHCRRTLVYGEDLKKVTKKLTETFGMFDVALKHPYAKDQSTGYYNFSTTQQNNFNPSNIGLNGFGADGVRRGDFMYARVIDQWHGKWEFAGARYAFRVQGWEKPIWSDITTSNILSSADPYVVLPIRAVMEFYDGIGVHDKKIWPGDDRILIRCNIWVPDLMMEIKAERFVIPGRFFILEEVPDVPGFCYSAVFGTSKGSMRLGLPFYQALEIRHQAIRCPPWIGLKQQQYALEHILPSRIHLPTLITS